MTEDAIRVSPRTPSDAGADRVAGRGGGGGRPAGRGGRGGGLPVTTELVVFAAIALAVLIAAAVAENFSSTAAWTMVTVLAAAYILSRGLAKHEHPHHDPLD
jgi:hypothetical protein